jgi:glycosyltransferase involved in cell wall biosynthesis
MRVLYINPFSQEVSGPDESLRALLGALIPTGVEPHVVLPAPGPQVPRYEKLGVTVHFAPLAIVRRNLSLGAGILFPARLARGGRRVIEIAKAVEADLIHSNTEVTFEGGVAARMLGLPHVLHYRGNTFDRPKWAFDALVAAWNASADHIFCISEATAAVFERRNRARKVEVLYNPVDLASFVGAARSAEVRATLGAEADQPLIGTVSRIHPRKDLETFARAAALIVRRYPNARFTIVGSAEGSVEHAYRGYMERLILELKLESHLTFTGARRDVAAVMKALDIFVLASHYEGFGRVVAEAMAAGRPVIVGDEGALSEIVEADRYGLVARPRDPEDFARQVFRLLSSPAEAAALSGRALERAQIFDARTVATRVRARYDALV